MLPATRVRLFLVRAAVAARLAALVVRRADVLVLPLRAALGGLRLLSLALFLLPLPSALPKSWRKIRHRAGLA